ncbi:hypothetical protein [Anatilimnocola floriformis]|uniref:hypothetical protein n=1 Tax=Anatilimnocola floriformis TaxID=2948575 RepID=UPI0020C5060F|nr:hypothetical protein [Anatilimnocola floriformis]
MAKSKQSRGKGPKAAAPQGKPEPAVDPAPGDSTDPLRAFPADPPQRNLKLLILSAILFLAWFCFLAYVALGT